MYWLRLCLFIVAIAAQVDEHYNFTEDKETLSKCIENYLRNSDDPYYRNLETVQNIANLTARRFHGRSRNLPCLIKTISDFYHYAREKHPDLFDHHLAVKPLQSLLKDALIECAKLGDVLEIPVFKEEPVEIGALLDYILVVWPKSLFDMIRTRNGRNLIRRYAKEALSKLLIALQAVHDHEYFRHLLRSYWMIRAQYYFDGRDSQIPYLRHRYSLRYPYPHTYDDFNALFSRNNRHLLDRNPWVLAQDYRRIMYLHTPDRAGYGEKDVFSIYERNGGIRSAEYYIETHIDQFYRIIFYYMELQVHGLSRDEDDRYMGLWPGNVMPEQNILRTDFAYQNYLLNLREQLEQTHLGHILQSARIMEEDLVTLYSTQIQQQNISCREFGGHEKVSDPMSTTTSSSRQLNRKECTSINKSGKNFCMDPEPSCFGEGQQQQATESDGECQNSEAIEPFPEEESSIFLTTLGLTMTESQIGGWHGL